MKFGQDARTLQVAEDYQFRPHECKPIVVDGQFVDDREWLVKKSLLANANESFFAVPNVLITGGEALDSNNQSFRPSSLHSQRRNNRKHH